MAQTQDYWASGKLSSYLSRLNPVPSFADYTGPYRVGTVDVEVPVSDLDSPAPAPSNAANIETVQFRIFYPAPDDATGKNITWLPAPQRDHLSAYIKFLGVGNFWAQAASFLPRHLHYTTIPVLKNAPILSPDTPNQRWPTAIFSHGLGGNRNAYSSIAGSLASHGVVVICPEHRDGSAAVSFVRIPSEQSRYFVRNTRWEVPYNRIPHDATDEVHEKRNDQLRIRLWELGLIHEAMLATDEGRSFTNLNTSTPSLGQFIGRLHIQEPGSIIFMGHSFGSATTVQFLKSVFYADHPSLAEMNDPLYVPAAGSSIRRQVTPDNVTILLDMWCFPLLAKSTSALFNLPLPIYAPNGPRVPGGSALLAVDSDDFYKWTEHLHATARILSPQPSASTVQPDAFTHPETNTRLPEPNFFYVRKAAHLNQSDFGILFPFITKKIFGSDDPDRVLRLNMRAMLQVLRRNGVPVARTAWGDLAEGPETVLFGKEKGALQDAGSESEEESEKKRRRRSAEGGTTNDDAILARGASTGIKAWQWIDVIGMGRHVADADGKLKQDDEVAQEKEPEMAGVIEPGVDDQAPQKMRDAVQQVGAPAA